MTRMAKAVPKAAMACAVSFLAACGADDPSPRIASAARFVESPLAAPAADELPAWITEPSALPAGLVGTNNCTFPFGPKVPQWDFHPDAGCWEHAGPDGWTRQQFQRIHIPHYAFCGGGPGDATAIRICRAPGEPNPCFIDELTGPTGCARCVVHPTCGE